MLRYGSDMIDTTTPSLNPQSLEQELSEALERADSDAATVVPILRHVLSNEDNSLFGDEIVARIRGMVRHLAVQLLDRLESGAGEHVPSEHGDQRVAQLADRLHARFGTDPVLTPLLQAQISAADSDLSALAMRFLAAQARHGQSQRRMKLPLFELPGDHLHHALLAAQSIEPASGEAAAAAAQHVRREYDEAATRLGLASLLLARMGAGAAEALAINHAGVALFTSALALGSGLDRDAAVLTTHETQAVRLALALRSAGSKPDMVRQQCLALHPDIDFPDQFDGIGPDRAAALLAAGSSLDGY